MAKRIVLYISVMLLFVLIGEIQCDFRRITYFLTKHEITEVKTVKPLNRNIKFHNLLHSTSKSIQITAFENTFTVDLIAFFHRADFEVLYISKLINSSVSFVTTNYFIHHGTVRGVENSFAMGYFFEDKSFAGYIVTDDVYCIEPYGKPNSVIVYRFKDVIVPGCSKRFDAEDLDCSESRYFMPWKANNVPPKRMIKYSYSLFYDKYLDLFDRLQAKKSKETHEKDHRETEKDRNINKTTRNNREIEENEYSRANHAGKERNKNNKNYYHIKNEPTSKFDKNGHRGSEKGRNDSYIHDGDDYYDDHKSNSNEKHNYYKNKHHTHHESDDKHKNHMEDDEKKENVGNLSKNVTYMKKYANADKMFAYSGSEQRKKFSETDNQFNSTEQDEHKTENKNSEDNNDIFEKDDDRFDLDTSYKPELGKQMHLVNSNESSRKKNKHDASDERNVFNQFYNDLKSTDVWKETLYEGIEKYDKQAENIEIKHSINNNKPIIKALNKDAETFQCNVQLVVSPSFRKKFGNNDELVLKDILIQFALLNKIFLKVPFKRNEEQIHLFFHVSQVVLYADEVYSPFTKIANLEYFTKVQRYTEENCLSIGLVSCYLNSGELFDGYIPEGGGGACADSGNTAIVSHGNTDTPTPMALFFAGLMRVLTRSLGANDKNPECGKGSYPNPMQVLQDYIKAEEVEIAEDYSFFSTCNIKNIEKTFADRDCFLKLSQPLCGNAILDPGEECDCGPAYLCAEIDPCCNTPNIPVDLKKYAEKLDRHHIGCTLHKQFQCSTLQECCFGCQYDQSESVCRSGSNDCDLGICDGKSGSCPTGVEASNGMVCFYNETQPEPLICNNGYCDKALCGGFGLEPCTCSPGTERDCVYCCVKDGQCKAAGSELNLFPGRNFTLPNGVECMGGTCYGGNCVRLEEEHYIYNFTLKKPPHFPAVAGSCIKCSALNSIVGTILSLLVLYLSRPISSIFSFL